MKRPVIFILKFVFSVILLIIFIKKIDIAQFYNIISTLNYKIILLLIFISFIQIAIIAAVQKHFLGNIGLGLNYNTVYKENLIAAAFGFIAPGMIGTDSYYTYSYGKKISNYTKALSGILFLRILGFFILILLVILSFIYVGHNIITIYNAGEIIDFNKIIIGLFGVSIFLVLLFVFFRKTILKYYQKIKNEFIDLLKITLKRKGALFIVILLLISFYSFSLGSRLVLADIAGIEMPILKLGAVILIVNFILMIPVSISGIGVREGGFIGLLSLYGVPPEKAFLLSFFDFSITFIAAMFGGVILLYRVVIKRKNYVR